MYWLIHINHALSRQPTYKLTPVKNIVLLTICLFTLTIVSAQQEERPQTPQPPFNYSIEEVEYDNADHSVHYGATLTIPKNKKNFPTIIIISGSGTQDRDGTLFGHKLYWVLADYLTNQGIAVLRVDDRGAGKSTKGPKPKELTSADFSYDVETSLNYLLSRKDINHKNIGLIGHSEGGAIAPMVAARRKEISFLVLWGAPAIGGAATNTSQNLFQLRKAKIDSTATVAFGVLHNQMLNQFTAPTKEQLNKQLDSVYLNWFRQQSPAVIKSLYATEKTIVGQGVQFMYDGLYDIPWMRYFINYNPIEDLKKITCRVLAINGEKDTQVEASSNLPLIEQTIKSSGNKKVIVQTLPNLNHLLQTANTGDVSEYQKIKETIAPSALELIANWINKK
ncbi:MAG: hypothetical protein FD136_711 [Chitinophagaceae bacterium]|nr:MAG: hypothetical protein FD136_711 [Chitinophagaceae bacterium]